MGSGDRTGPYPQTVNLSFYALRGGIRAPTTSHEPLFFVIDHNQSKSGITYVVNTSLLESLVIHPLYQGHWWFSGPINHPKGDRILRRSRETAEEVIRFLLSANESEPTRRLVDITIGDSGISSQSSKHYDYEPFLESTIFRSINFQFDRNRENCSTKRISFHHFGIQEPSLLDQVCPAQRSVNIISGICLFTSPDVERIKNTPITILQYPGSQALAHMLGCSCLYEVTTLDMLSTTIVNFVALISSNAGFGEPIQITLDVPRFQYYILGLQMVEAGAWSWADVAWWIAICQRKHAALVEVFTAMIKQELNIRNVDLGNVETIAASSGCSAAEEAFEDMVCVQNAGLSLKDAADVLREDKSNCWNELWGWLLDDDMPTTLVELGKLAYVYELVRPALMRRVHTSCRHCSKAHPCGNLTLLVDESFHFCIYERAAKILKRRPQCEGTNKDQLIAAFTFNQVCFMTPEGRQNLWHFDDSLYRED